MSFLTIVTIAVVLLMKTCFTTSDEWTVRDRGDGAPVIEEDAPGGTVGGSSKFAEATGKAKPVASRNLPGPEISDDQQGLAPIVVAAGRRPIASPSVISPQQADSIDSREETSLSESGETGIADSASTEVREKASTDISVAQDLQETILISFPFDSDDLIPDSHLALDRAATMLRDNIASVASITGFTDNQGDTQYNLVLSRKRANAVEQYLVGAGIARDRLRVEGRGALTDPVDAQDAVDEGAMEPYRIVRIKLGSDG